MPYQAVLEKHEGDASAAVLGFLEHVKDKEPHLEEIHAFAARTIAEKAQTANPVDKSAMIPMPVTVTASATAAFEKAKAAHAEKAAQAGEDEAEAVELGKECVRQGCTTKYTGPDSLKTVCVHHPGHAVFHETYKYWSCCDRNKKYDFDDFRAIKGCREGPETCAFTRAAAGLPKKAPCRHDYFQVGPTVTLNIYAKKVDPEQSTFLVSATQMRVKIVFDFGKEFTLNRTFPGEVNPAECKVEIKEPKIEITLKKGNAGAGGVLGAAWPSIGTPIEDDEK